jgi:predicted DNA-binding protein (MmcQ/YjbR family)
MKETAANCFFQALCEHCSSKPDAVEDHPWGETVFKIRGKVFAFLGTANEPGATIKADDAEIDGLLLLSFIRRSPYIGRYGWLRVAVNNEDSLDVALRLIDRSYELIEAKAPGKKKSASKGNSPKGSKSKRARNSGTDA